jgi:hypothetical protein
MTAPSCNYKSLPTHEKNNYTGRPSLIYTKVKLKSTDFVSRHYISNCGWHTSDSYYPAPPEKLAISCICVYLYEEGGGGGGMEDLAMPIQAITATPNTIHPSTSYLKSSSFFCCFGALPLATLGPLPKMTCCDASSFCSS